METDSRKPVNKLVYLLILGLTFGLVYNYTFDSKLAMLGDNAQYYILGKALSQGDGYVNIHQVSQRPNNHYPPGYPVIISAAMLFSDHITFIKLLNGLFFALSLWVLFELFLTITRQAAFAFVATFILILNTHLLYYSSVMMSEMPFLFFSGLALLLFVKTDFDQFSLKDPKFWIGILCLLISYYIRSLGIALLAGACLYFLFKKQWKPLAAFVIIFLLAAVPWIIRGQKLGGSSYIKQLTMINPYQPDLGQAGVGDFITRFGKNFSRYVTREIPDALLPTVDVNYQPPISGSEWLWGVILLALLIYGLITLPRYRWLITGYLLGTLGILMLWPEVWIGVRFIVPVIPIFFFVALFGLYNLLIKTGEQLKRQAAFKPFYMLILTLFFISPVHSLHKEAKTPLLPNWKNYFEIAEWLKKNEKPEILVSCGKPSLFYLYSGAYTMRYKFANDPDEVIADLEKNKVDYVVIDQVYGNTMHYLLPAIRKHPQRFQQVQHLKNPDTFLLKFQ